MDNFFGTSTHDHIKQIYEGIPVDKIKTRFTFGPFNSENIYRDAKRIGFLFARYKFAAKMLEGAKRVLEIGCQEGLGSIQVAQNVGNLVAIDFYRPHIENCHERYHNCITNIDFRGYDILDGPIRENFDGALSLDVLEHIDPSQEDLFMRNITDSLQQDSTFILGMPSLEFQQHASAVSRAGHVNCKSGNALRELCLRYFEHVYMFAMNDEVIHAGFLPMASYLIVICARPKKAA